MVPGKRFLRRSLNHESDIPRLLLQDYSKSEYIRFNKTEGLTNPTPLYHFLRRDRRVHFRGYSESKCIFFRKQNVKSSRNPSSLTGCFSRWTFIRSPIVAIVGQDYESGNITCALDAPPVRHISCSQSRKCLMCSGWLIGVIYVAANCPTGICGGFCALPKGLHIFIFG